MPFRKASLSSRNLPISDHLVPPSLQSRRRSGANRNTGNRRKRTFALAGRCLDPEHGGEGPTGFKVLSLSVQGLGRASNGLLAAASGSVPRTRTDPCIPWADSYEGKRRHAPSECIGRIVHVKGGCCFEPKLYSHCLWRVVLELLHFEIMSDRKRGGAGQIRHFAKPGCHEHRLQANAALARPCLSSLLLGLGAAAILLSWTFVGVFDRNWLVFGLPWLEASTPLQKQKPAVA